MDAAVLNQLTSENDIARAVIIGACAYECLAVATHRFPSISMLCWRLGVAGKILATAVLLILGAHLYTTPPSIRDLLGVPDLFISDVT